MADDQDFEEDFEYFMRNRVHLLGNLTIDFHEDPENVECICTRVLLKPKPPHQRKSAINVPLDVHPIVDHITFPAPEVSLHPSVSINDIGNNINEIIVDSTVDHSDENQLISSDTEENTSCCGFVKMVRSLQKKLKRRKNRTGTPVDDKDKIEASTTNQQPSAEPESIIEKEDAEVPDNWEDLETPSEVCSKSPENGIAHLGYVFEKPKVTNISQIHWEYDEYRINQWNAPLTLQTAKKPEPANSIDWWDADPDTYRTYVPRTETVDTVVSEEQTEPAPRKRRNKKKKNKKSKPKSESLPSPSTPNPKKKVTKSESVLSPPSTPNPEPIVTNSESVLSPSTPDPEMISTISESVLTPSEKASMRITEAMPPEIRADRAIQKYWKNRCRLFSKYNLGVRLDRESWYSVTPEKVAEHIADRCRCDVIIDGFCGAGGNTIQFAFTCERVIAVDIDPEKIELARHNAKIYGVYDRIEFIVGDFFEVVPHLTADVVFLSPPWGGPSYNQQSSFPLSEICPPDGGEDIFAAARIVTKNIAYYLPRNINTAELMPLGKEDRIFELEQNVLTDKLVAVTAYFGNLVMKPTKT